jgi:hypothetical protein
MSAMMILACGGDKSLPKAEEPRAPEVVIAESTLAAAPASGTACPAYGLWRACSVEDRIARAGLAVKRRDEGVRHDFMSVEGIVWETSRAEVQVFLYSPRPTGSGHGPARHRDGLATGSPDNLAAASNS